MSARKQKIVHEVTLIPGDGIGPEIVAAVRLVFARARAPILWRVFSLRHPLEPETLRAISQTRVAPKGPLATPTGKGHRSLNVALREHFELFANVRPVRSFPGISPASFNIDLVIVRENLEDLYGGIEFPRYSAKTKTFIRAVQKLTTKQIRKDAAIALKIISAKRTRDIVRFAFDFAYTQKRKSITVVHKANILKETDGLFLNIAARIARRHPTISFEEKIVDNMVQQLVLRPQAYDILLCPNLYGDILSDLAAALVGGLGVAPAANIGKRVAIFEAVHGTAPDIAEKNIANPTALLLAGVMMLEHLGERRVARRIRRAIEKTFQGGVYTRDLGGRATTRSFVEAVTRFLAKA